MQSAVIGGPHDEIRPTSYEEAEDIVLDFGPFIRAKLEDPYRYDGIYSSGLFPYYAEVPKDYELNLEYRKMVLSKINGSRSYLELFLEKCAADCLYYINTSLWTYSPKDYPEDPRRPFITYACQDYLVLNLLKAIGNHDLTVLKSRDMGVTWITLAVIHWKWMFQDEQSFLLVSRKEEYVDKTGAPRELFWKLDYMNKHLPERLLPEGIVPFQRNKFRRQKTLINPRTRSTIAGEATVQDLSRGDRLTAIMVDEAASIKDFELVQKASRDATKSRIFISTPKGRNAFYDQVIKSFRCDQLFVLHWSMHPNKREGLYIYERGDVQPRVYHGVLPSGYNAIQDGKIRSIWYDQEESRATKKSEIAEELDLDFYESGHSPYLDAEVLGHLVGQSRAPHIRGTIVPDPSMIGKFAFIEDPQGEFAVWDSRLLPMCEKGRPREIDKMYRPIIGIDIATGSGGPDCSNSVLCVFSVDEMSIGAELVSSEMEIEDLALTTYALATWLNGALVIWEDNGIGNVFGRYLFNRLGYRNVYMRMVSKGLYDRPTRVPGWYSTPRERRILLTQLAIAIREYRIKIPSRDTIKDLSNYVYTEDGDIRHPRRPKGEGHGDRVIALALAYRATIDVPNYRAIIEREETDPEMMWYKISPEQRNNIFIFASRRMKARRMYEDGRFDYEEL